MKLDGTPVRSYYGIQVPFWVNNEGEIRHVHDFPFAKWPERSYAVECRPVSNSYPWPFDNCYAAMQIGWHIEWVAFEGPYSHEAMLGVARRELML
jgi:hypothetical protein